MKNFREILFYVAVGVGLAIANSSFIIISGMFKDSGLATVLPATILGGLACLLVSGAVAELASAFPGTPGIRTYIKAAFGPDISLACVLLYLVMIMLVAGVECFVFANVVNRVAPDLPPLAVGLGVLVAVILLNLVGFEFSKNAQVLSTLILVLSLVGMGLAGIASGRSTLGAMSLSGPEWGRLPALIGLAIFLFVGFEWVTPLGLNKRAYLKKIPLSMNLSILVNMGVYAVFVVGMGCILSSAEISATETPQVEFNQRLFGGLGGGWVLLMSTLAIFSTFNAGLMGSARLLYAVAREGAAPRFCARISAKGDPMGATLVLGAGGLASAVVVFSFQWQMVAAILASAIVCAVYSLLILSLWKLRKDRKIPAGGFKTVLGNKSLVITAAFMGMLSVASLFSVAEFSLAAGLAFAAAVAACASAGRVASLRTGSPSAQVSAPPSLKDENVAIR